MMVRKAVTGSVLAAGVLAGMFGAMGTAQAAPGVSFSPSDGNDPIGVGDNSAKGASSSASKGNTAVAVSLWSNPRARADANHGTGNLAVAFGGVADTGYGTTTSLSPGHWASPKSGAATTTPRCFHSWRRSCREG